MRDTLLGLIFLAAFVSIAVGFLRHANARDRYESALYDMPLWWMAQRQYGRRQS